MEVLNIFFKIEDILYLAQESVLENYRILSEYINIVVSLFTWMIGFDNLWWDSIFIWKVLIIYDEIQYLYERKKYDINILQEYCIIIPAFHEVSLLAPRERKAVHVHPLEKYKHDSIFFVPINTT